MNLFITLLENVNKSRTSANNVSLNFRSPRKSYNMGVITLTDIDYGHIFGPYPSHVTPADPAYLIGMLTNDKKPEGFMLKVGLKKVHFIV
jgi:hypothetical protein